MTFTFTELLFGVAVAVVFATLGAVATFFVLKRHADWFAKWVAAEKVFIAKEKALVAEWKNTEKQLKHEASMVKATVTTPAVQSVPTPPPA